MSLASAIILVGCVVLVFANAWLFRETRRLREENRKLREANGYIAETLARFEDIVSGRGRMLSR